MFCHKGSELAIGISIERPMLSGMHLVFPSRLVVVLLLQFVVFVTWVVDRLSRVSLLHHVKWLWCLLLFSASASEACYLLSLETAEEEPHEDHFTVLPPRDGDVGDAESELEDVCLTTWRMKMVSRLLENSRSTTALTKSRKVETWTLILKLLARMFADKTFCVGENVQASTFLWMILAFKLTLRKSFPASPYSLHFAFGVKSSHLP